MRRRILVVSCALYSVALRDIRAVRAGGVYTVATCPGPSNVDSGWSSDEFGPTIGPRRAFEDCVLGNQFGLDLGGAAVEDGAIVGWTFNAPGSSFIQGFRWQRRVNATAPYVYELSGGRGQPMLESSNPSRAPEFAAPNDLWESRYGTVQGTSLTMRMRCEASPGTLCDEKPATVTFRAAEIDIVDVSHPLVLTSLVSEAPPGNRPDSFTLYTAHRDDNSGVKSLRSCRTTGDRLCANDLNGACSLATRPSDPVPAFATLNAVIPRSAVVDGPLELEVYAEDGRATECLLSRSRSTSSSVEPPSTFKRRLCRRPDVDVPAEFSRRPSQAAGQPGPSAYSQAADRSRDVPRRRRRAHRWSALD